MQTCIIRSGRTLDFTTVPAFRAACDRELEAGVKQFVLDFGEAGMLGSAGLGAIIALDRRVRGQGGAVVFARVKGAVAAIIATTNIHRHFLIYESIEEAVEHLDASDPRLTTLP